MEPLISGGPAATAPADLIKDGSTATFMADVVEASKQVPVIVDFWATWCGPCKQLSPALEKAVSAARGAVKLVKIDVDQNQDLAAQFRVQSIPSVFAFKDGQPVDGFAGALPESQIKDFIKRLTGETGPSPVDQALEQAQAAYDTGDFGAAGNLYMQVLQEDPASTTAVAGVIRCAVASGQLEQAREILGQLPEEALKDAEIAAAKTALDLAEAGQSAGDTAGLEAQVAANANDHQARFDLAAALFGGGEEEAAIDHLLEIVGRDRQWQDDGARKRLVEIFEALGPAHPATVAGRRKLSAMLFA
jgi:putative thioredoxin